MNEIRDLLYAIRGEVGEGPFADTIEERSDERIRKRCDEALALLPPEGETRPKHDMLFIDATPDEGYIARILSAYIDDSYYSDNTAGLPPENWLCIKMNEWREQRNALLRAALAKLAEPAPSSEKALREYQDVVADLLGLNSASGRYDATLRVYIERLRTVHEKYHALPPTAPAPEAPKEEHTCETCLHKDNAEHEDDWACSHCDFNCLWERSATT